LRGPVLPIPLGGTLLALLLIGAAGSYWADRRLREVRLLSARGVGPSALAGKAVLELALPAVAGTLVGALARWLVARLCPAPTSTPARTGRRRSSWPPACWPGWRCSAWSPAPAAETRPSGPSAPAGPGWPGCPGRCCCSAARSARTRRCGTTER
jgi:putative ABC transport system permease protein